MTDRVKILISFAIPMIIGILFLISFINTCQRFEPELFLEITTDSMEIYSDSEFELHGTIESFGQEKITQHGFCWTWVNRDPTLEDDLVQLGVRDIKGSFTCTISGIASNTTFNLRAYVTTNAGTVYGNRISFTTPIRLPIVNTTAVSNLTYNSAQSGGQLISDGDSPIVSRGVCWNKSQNPTVSNSKTDDGNGMGNYTSYITGLDPYTTYYLRAYAVNSDGTAYGQEVSFTTSWDNSTITDYDGNVYNTIQIGDQVWMSENMKAIHYSNGSSIPLVEGTSEWDALTETDKAYCWYNNSPSIGNTYGALYTWAAIMNGAESSSANPSGVQGICPASWHLPSDAEWKQLELYLGMSQAEANLEGNRGTDVGGKLKESGAAYWNSPNTGATNESGFTARPAGRRTNVGSFVNLNTYTELWTTSQNNSYDVWDRGLSYNHGQISRGDHYKNVGLSVRCLKDSP